MQAVQLFTTGPAPSSNPVRHAATLRGVTPGAAVQVLDALGRHISTTTADAEGRATLVLPTGLPAGVYLVYSGALVTRLVVR